MPVDEGTIRSIRLDLSAGSPPGPYNVVGGNGLNVIFEHSNRELGSDFTFTRLKGRLDFRINTFLKRRFLPNTLDISVIGFTSAGSLPVQRFMGIDGSMAGWAPFGVFRSAPNRQLEGEHGAALFWEHNFRTVPFELLGLRRLVDNGVGIIVSGGHGRTWIDQKRLDELTGPFFHENQWRHEAGLSINNILSIMRFDITGRIDEPGFYFGIGLTRFF